VPLRFDWSAFENAIDETRRGPDAYNHNADLQDPDIALFHSNLKEEYGEAELDGHHVRDVGKGSKRLVLKHLH
jgi:hypothetical protein